MRHFIEDGLKVLPLTRKRQNELKTSLVSHSNQKITIVKKDYKGLYFVADKKTININISLNIMRFPVNYPPPITVGDEFQDVNQVDALKVVRPVDVRTRPAMFRQYAGNQKQDTGLVRARMEQAPKKGEAPDRRKMCRRIYHKPVILDTRSGKDRRAQSRRDEDIATHIAILG